MWHSICTSSASTDWRSLEKKRRTRNVEDQSHGEIEPLWKKRRHFGAAISPPTPKTKRDRSIGIATKGMGGKNRTVSPPAASSSFNLPECDRLIGSVPRLDDSVDEVLSKLTVILDAVRVGRSIAETTAYSAALHKEGNAEMIARSQMLPQEYEAWTTFNDGLWRLPELDWDNDQLPPPTSAKSLKVANRRTEALNRLYKTDRAREGNIA